MSDARFHVNEFRGFEKFCEGRLMWEMPGITSRICGICPASHLIASAKAGDDILAIGIPETAEKLRRLMTLAQWIQSHALSFFHLSLARPAARVRQRSAPAERLRADRGRTRSSRDAGSACASSARKSSSCSAGGASTPRGPWPAACASRSTPARRDRLLAWIPEAKETALIALATFKDALEPPPARDPELRQLPLAARGPRHARGALEYYGGVLRVRDGDGNTVADQIDPRALRRRTSAR